MSIVSLNIQYFPDPTIGRPVQNGSIYVGLTDTDPTVPSNQVAVRLRQEDGTEVATSQPVLTSAGGVPLYNGSPVQIIVDVDYSLAVLNKQGTQVYYVPQASAFSVLGSIRPIWETQTATAGQTVFTIGTFTYSTGTNDVIVEIDGRRQYLSEGAYTETSSTQITFSEGLAAGQVVFFASNEIGNASVALEGSATRDDAKAILWAGATDIPEAGKVATWDGMPWVDARMYGMSTTASGLVNSQALQAAIDYADTSGLKLVRILPDALGDTYILDGTVASFGGAESAVLIGTAQEVDIEVVANLTIDPATTVDDYGVFHIRSNIGCRIYGSGTLTGAIANVVEAGGQAGILVKIYDADNVIVEGLTIKDSWTDGVYADATFENVKIRNNIISGCRRNGISIILGNNFVIEGNKITAGFGQAPEACIDIEPNAGDVITNGMVFNNELICLVGSDPIRRPGVYLQSGAGGFTSEVAVIGNKFVDSKLSMSNVDNCVAIGNVLTYPNFAIIGLIIEGSRNIVVQSNTVDGSSGNYIGYSEDLLFDGNRITNCTGTGIELNHSGVNTGANRNVVVSNNSIRDNVGIGIKLQYGSNNKAIDNTIINCGGTGILVIATQNAILRGNIIAGAGYLAPVTHYSIQLSAVGLMDTIIENNRSLLHEFNTTGTAQAGGASTITLDAGSSDNDDEYVGLNANIASGTGSGQTLAITAYDGATKVATVATPWATAPDSTSVYHIIPTNYVANHILVPAGPVRTIVRNNVIGTLRTNSILGVGTLTDAPHSSTTALLTDITADINVYNKAIGKPVFNVNTSKTVFAVNVAAGSVWVDAQGVTVHTPV